MKLSPWFQQEDKSVHIGIYQTLSDNDIREFYYSYFALVFK